MAANGQITLGRLQKVINDLLKTNPELKDHAIVISNDNEGNGFHGMFYEVTYKPNDVKAFEDDIYDSAEKDINKIVILG